MEVENPPDLPLKELPVDVILPGRSSNFLQTTDIERANITSMNVFKVLRDIGQTLITLIRSPVIMLPNSSS